MFSVIFHNHMAVLECARSLPSGRLQNACMRIFRTLCLWKEHGVRDCSNDNTLSRVLVSDLRVDSVYCAPMQSWLLLLELLKLFMVEVPILVFPGSIGHFFQKCEEYGMEPLLFEDCVALQSFFYGLIRRPGAIDNGRNTSCSISDYDSTYVGGLYKYFHGLFEETRVAIPFLQYMLRACETSGACLAKTGALGTLRELLPILMSKKMSSGFCSLEVLTLCFFSVLCTLTQEARLDPAHASILIEIFLRNVADRLACLTSCGLLRIWAERVCSIAGVICSVHQPWSERRDRAPLKVSSCDFSNESTSYECCSLQEVMFLRSLSDSGMSMEDMLDVMARAYHPGGRTETFLEICPMAYGEIQFPYPALDFWCSCINARLQMPQQEISGRMGSLLPLSDLVADKVLSTSALFCDIDSVLRAMQICLVHEPCSKTMGLDCLIKKTSHQKRWNRVQTQLSFPSILLCELRKLDGGMSSRAKVRSMRRIFQLLPFLCLDFGLYLVTKTKTDWMLSECLGLESVSARSTSLCFHNLTPNQFAQETWNMLVVLVGDTISNAHLQEVKSMFFLCAQFYYGDCVLSRSLVTVDE